MFDFSWVGTTGYEPYSDLLTHSSRKIDDNNALTAASGNVIYSITFATTADSFFFLTGDVGCTTPTWTPLSAADYSLTVKYTIGASQDVINHGNAVDD